MYTGTRPGVSPAIRAGKGWRGRRELAPRCSATQLGASRWRISTETCVIHEACTTTITHSTTTTTPGEGFFRTSLPQILKSAKLASHSGSELLPESSPSTPAAEQEVSVEWVRLRERHAGKTYFWNRRTNSTVWQAPAGVEVVWYAERTEEGGIWYWYRDTRVSTFDLPPRPPG